MISINLDQMPHSVFAEVCLSQYLGSIWYIFGLYFSSFFNQGPVVQSIVSLTSSLMTKVLTVVAKVFSNTLIFLLQKFLQHKTSL